jgi:hypothetical protein
MNLFTKSKIISILEYKVNTGEIKFYKLSDSSLHIKKSKRTNITISTNKLSDDILVRLLVKKIPDPSIINISDFYKRELRQLKIYSVIR